MTDNDYIVAGIMSGTSCDGIDIALCRFVKKKNKWDYSILKAKTFTYSQLWKNKLSEAGFLDAINFLKFHNEYGNYTGKLINKYLSKEKSTIDFISSHGHTIFHDPEKGITFQAGNGACIAAETGITTVCDFRTNDVAKGGQGAPLVPAGDGLLFGEYDFCLNIGGISNISFNEKNKRIAFDICPANLLINHYTRQNNIDFDKDGKIAAKGKINSKLLSELNKIKYYKDKYPKSIGKEYIENKIFTVIDNFSLSLEDKLRTIYEHISLQISGVLNKKTGKDNSLNVLVTGGGAYNKFLMKLIKEKSKVRIVIPGKKIIEFKEALIFAFLGILKMRNEVNCLASVTGARKDHCSGVIFNN